jgi:hypothetical protein
MDRLTGDGSESRFSVYVEGLVEVIGHATGRRRCGITASKQDSHALSTYGIISTGELPDVGETWRAGPGSIYHEFLTFYARLRRGVRNDNDAGITGQGECRFKWLQQPGGREISNRPVWQSLQGAFDHRSPSASPPQSEPMPTQPPGARGRWEAVALDRVG